MTADDLVRLPGFITPADDARLALFSERHTRQQVRLQLFDASDGVQRFILADRQQALGDDRILVEGEEAFLEGFLGDSGLHLVLPEGLEAWLKTDTDEPTATL